MTLTTDTGTDPDAAELRAAMVARFEPGMARFGVPMSPALRRALLTVPRHLFTPGVPLERAYDADQSIVTKTGEDGRDVSAVSAPWLIATMLAQAGDLSGKRVLEIGSGGYNAALLRDLVGPDGDVTTVDIDPEVVDRARACLDRAGYADVRAFCRDGDGGAPDQAPFDVIISTVGTWDVPGAWRQQLALDGRIVLPLRTGGLTRAWGLDRQGGSLLVSATGPVRCGFVAMRGAGAHGGRSTPLADTGVGLWQDELSTVDSSGLGDVLAASRTEVWSGVVLPRGTRWDDQDLWLLALPGHCQMTASRDAVASGVVTPSWRILTPALVDGDSLAYRAALRPVGDPAAGYEVGAVGHGPRGGDLAERLAEAIRGWDEARRRGDVPRLTVAPADAPVRDLPDGYVLPKRHSTLVLSWGQANPRTGETR